MKKQSLFRMSFLILCLWVSSAQAQSRLVNQSTYSLGRPSLIYEYSRALPIGNGNIAILDNYYNSITSPDNEDFDLAVFSPDSGLIGGNDYFSLHGQSDFGTNMYIRNGFLYAVGFTTDSTFTNRLNCNLIKFNLSTLDTAWTVTENISGAVQQAATSVIADDTGYIYMAAAVQTSTDNKISLIKYDQSGNKIWQSDYDTTGFTAVPVAMAFSGSYVTVTGFIYDNMGNSFFLTYHVVRNTGTREPPKYTANGIGAISHPIGLLTDSSRNSYIAGTSTIAGFNSSVIKLVGYDSVFNSLFVSTWGDSSQNNQATSMAGDGTQKHSYITGSSPNTSGGTDLIVLRYNTDGSLSWSKRLSAPNPANGMGGVSITTGQDYSAYVTGWVFNGVDTNVVTAAIDSGGTLLWQQVYARTLSSTDVPYSITMGDDGMTVYVTTRSIGPDSQYVMLQYKQDGTVNAPDSTIPSQQWAYYENKGQVIDTGTHQASYVHYYTNTANPRIYITDYALSYVFSNRDSLTDTLQRIDMTLEKSEIGNDPTTPTYYSTEQIQPYLNYYIGGLPEYYEDVHGYQRVTAKGIYPNIDCQLYSDNGGLKYYYVINPGGSPTDIQFKYTGADSITHDSTGMKIYNRYGIANQLPFTAWQYSGGSAIQISLTLSLVSSTEFTFSVGSYNTSLPLFIRVQQAQQTQSCAQPTDNIEWATYWGGHTRDIGTAIDATNPDQFFTGYSLSTNFPTTTGLMADNGFPGAFLTKFDTANLVQWSTYYAGTSGNTFMQSVAVVATEGDAIGNIVYIAGTTGYTDLPMPNAGGGALHNGTFFGGAIDIFLAKFDALTGALNHATYIGSNGNDFGTCLALNTSLNTLFLGGTTRGTNFPYYNGFTGSNFYDTTGRGVIMELSVGGPVLKLASGFGSSQLNTSIVSGTVSSMILDIKFDKNKNVLITGSTGSSFSYSGSNFSGMPNTNSYSQSFAPASGYQSAFIAKFTPVVSGTSEYKLYYYSLFGGSQESIGRKVCANSKGEFYMIGSDSCAGYPFAPSGVSCPSPATNLFLSKFSADGVLENSNIYSGSGILTNPDGTVYRGGDILCDAYDNLYIYAYTHDGSSINLASRSGYYFDNNSGSSSCNGCFKTAIIELDSSQNLVWGTLFGDIANNTPGGMSLDANNNLYICGSTSTNQNHASCSDNFPLKTETGATNVASNDSASNAVVITFIAKFQTHNVPTAINAISKSGLPFSCYPNPSGGSFTVDMSGFGTGIKSLYIYDNMGRLIYTQQTSEDKVPVSMANMNTGIYFVRVCQGDRVATDKIIITGQQ